MAYGGGIGNGCLVGSRFTMSAVLLHQDSNTSNPIDMGKYGEWVRSQDPLTKEIIRVWKPYENTGNPDDPATEEDESIFVDKINCMARGVVDGGVRVGGSTEKFGDIYESIDLVKMWVPAHIKINKRDRVTNIKDSSGTLLWAEEEYHSDEENIRATVFNVNGVIPLLNPFNAVVEQFVMLERAEVSDG